MPDLDITELFEDPDLADCFSVKRRKEVVDVSTGLSTQETELFHNVYGFVIAIDPKGNDRTSDAQMTSRAIEVCTSFRLRPASEGVQPDVIIHAGIEYTITSFKDHLRWGSGWVKVEAESMNASDAPAELRPEDAY